MLANISILLYLVLCWVMFKQESEIDAESEQLTYSHKEAGYMLILNQRNL